MTSSHRSSSEATTTYRDHSPPAPLLPIAPTSLPRWLRPIRGRGAFVGNSKVRLAFLALGCVVLGWMVTSTLGPSDESPEYLTVYDAASGGVLGNPSGFGEPDEESEMIGSSYMYEGLSEKQPSVKGALSDLHHAVSDRLQAWKSYATNTDKTSSANRTSSHASKNTSSPLPLGEYITDGIPEDQLLGARTRVGKCTILFNGNEYWERAIRTHEEHDRLHGYRLHVLRQQLLDDVWSKPAYVLSLLLRELSKPESERLEWLFWVDADTVILNPYVPIEIFLPPHLPEFEETYLLYSNDWNGLNNGVFLVRVNQWAVKLFTAIVAYRHFKPNEKLQFRDQSAMDNVMKEPYFVNNVVQAPQRWFNAYQGEHNDTLAPFQIRRGDLLVHFAGVPAREQRMGFWLDRAEEHLDDWEVPVKSTSYPQERKDFWDELSRGRQGQKEEMNEARQKATQLLDSMQAQLEEYGDRVSVGDKEAINQQRAAISRVMGDNDFKDNLDRLNEEIGKLEETAKPLARAVKNSHKVLLNAAHDAIFAGEKDLLDANYATDPTNPELQAIENNIARLKGLVMAPQSEWKKPTITAATNQLTEARAKIKEKLAESGKSPSEPKPPTPSPVEPNNEKLSDGAELKPPTPNAVEPNSSEHTEASRGDAKGPLDEKVDNAAENPPVVTVTQEALENSAQGPPPVVTVTGEAVVQEPHVVTVTGEAVIQTVTHDADGQAVSAEAVVVTNTGPATTVVHVQTVVGEAVIATVTGEAIAVTVTQDAVPVTLWTVVEEEAAGGTAVALPGVLVGEAVKKHKEKIEHKQKEGHKEEKGEHKKEKDHKEG